MNLDFITLGEYSQFIWPAFIFTFIAFFVLYLKTIKEFKHQEKKFLSKFKQKKSIKIGVIKEKRALSEEVIF